MLHARLETLDENTLCVRLDEDAAPISALQVLESWRDDENFREFFTSTVSGCAFEAFFFETPPFAQSTLSRPFECVLVNAPALSRVRSDPTPFSSHFAAHPDRPIHTFPNLGGDAVLIVPAPVAKHDTYTHLARFLRTAPRNQVDEFWKSVGAAMSARVSHAPLWLSTAGLGVSWLHLRLDSRPKYYRHAPYTIAA